jgi:hypothetical protein
LSPGPSGSSSSPTLIARVTPPMSAAAKSG